MWQMPSRRDHGKQISGEGFAVAEVMGGEAETKKFRIERTEELGLHRYLMQRERKR